MTLESKAYGPNQRTNTGPDLDHNNFHNFWQHHKFQQFSPKKKKKKEERERETRSRRTIIIITEKKIRIIITTADPLPTWSTFLFKSSDHGS